LRGRLRSAFMYRSAARPDLHSFPTRRSSDLKAGKISTPIATRKVEDRFIDLTPAERAVYDAVEEYISRTYNQAAEDKRSAVGFVDRKSTRLNSSHVKISYAVFCLKKKKEQQT